MQTPFGRQQYNAIHLTNVQQIIAAWPFLVKGWRELCSPEKGRSDLNEGEFLTMLLRIQGMGPNDGVLVLFTSKNDKPLGYMVVMNDSETPHRRTALIYLGYSNGLYAQAPVVATEYVERWARERGFTELHAQSRRLSGAAMRLFRKKLGFQPMAVVFSKTL